MANTLKSKKQSKISEENLNPDKEADVSVTDVVKEPLNRNTPTIKK